MTRRFQRAGRSRNTGCRAEQQGIGRQIGDRALAGRGGDNIGLSGVAHDRVSRQSQAAGRRHDPAADVAKAVVILADRDRWGGDDQVGGHQIGGARGVHPQGQHHRCLLRRLVSHLITDTDLHRHSETPQLRTRRPGNQPNAGKRHSSPMASPPGGRSGTFRFCDRAGYTRRREEPQGARPSGGTKTRRDLCR